MTNNDKINEKESQGLRNLNSKETSHNSGTSSLRYFNTQESLDSNHEVNSKKQDIDSNIIQDQVKAVQNTGQQTFDNQWASIQKSRYNDQSPSSSKDPYRLESRKYSFQNRTQSNSTINSQIHTNYSQDLENQDQSQIKNQITNSQDGSQERRPVWNDFFSRSFNQQNAKCNSSWQSMNPANLQGLQLEKQDKEKLKDDGNISKQPSNQGLAPPPYQFRKLGNSEIIGDKKSNSLKLLNNSNNNIRSSSSVSNKHNNNIFPHKLLSLSDKVQSLNQEYIQAKLQGETMLQNKDIKLNAAQQKDLQAMQDLQLQEEITFQNIVQFLQDNGNTPNNQQLSSLGQPQNSSQNLDVSLGELTQKFLRIKKNLDQISSDCQQYIRSSSRNEDKTSQNYPSRAQSGDSQLQLLGSDFRKSPSSQQNSPRNIRNPIYRTSSGTSFGPNLNKNAYSNPSRSLTPSSPPRNLSYQNSLYQFNNISPTLSLPHKTQSGSFQIKSTLHQGSQDFQSNNNMLYNLNSGQVDRISNLKYPLNNYIVDSPKDVNGKQPFNNENEITRNDLQQTTQQQQNTYQQQFVDPRQQYFRNRSLSAQSHYSYNNNLRSSYQNQSNRENQTANIQRNSTSSSIATNNNENRPEFEDQDFNVQVQNYSTGEFKKSQMRYARAVLWILTLASFVYYVIVRSMFSLHGDKVQIINLKAAIVFLVFEILAGIGLLLGHLPNLVTQNRSYKRLLKQLKSQTTSNPKVSRICIVVIHENTDLKYTQKSILESYKTNLPPLAKRQIVVADTQQDGELKAWVGNLDSRSIQYMNVQAEVQETDASHRGGIEGHFGRSLKKKLKQSGANREGNQDLRQDHDPDQDRFQENMEGQVTLNGTQNMTGGNELRSVEQGEDVDQSIRSRRQIGQQRGREQGTQGGTRRTKSGSRSGLGGRFKKERISTERVSQQKILFMAIKKYYQGYQGFLKQDQVSGLELLVCLQGGQVLREDAFSIATPLLGLGKHIAAIAFPPSFKTLRESGSDHFNVSNTYRWKLVQPGLDATSSNNLDECHLIINFASLNILNLSADAPNPNVCQGGWGNEISQRLSESNWDTIFVRDNLIVSEAPMHLHTQVMWQHIRFWRHLKLVIPKLQGKTMQDLIFRCLQTWGGQAYQEVLVSISYPLLYFGPILVILANVYVINLEPFQVKLGLTLFYVLNFVLTYRSIRWSSVQAVYRFSNSLISASFLFLISILLRLLQLLLTSFGHIFARLWKRWRKSETNKSTSKVQKPKQQFMPLFKIDQSPRQWWKLLVSFSGWLCITQFVVNFLLAILSLITFIYAFAHSNPLQSPQILPLLATIVLLLNFANHISLIVPIIATFLYQVWQNRRDKNNSKTPAQSTGGQTNRGWNWVVSAGGSIPLSSTLIPTLGSLLIGFRIILGLLFLIALWSRQPVYFDKYQFAMEISQAYYVIQQSGSQPTLPTSYFSGVDISKDFPGFPTLRPSGLQDVAAGSNLRGGWYQGGDMGYMKVSLPIAYTTTMLSWGHLLFQDGFKLNGPDQANLSFQNIQHGAQYLSNLGLALPSQLQGDLSSDTITSQINPTVSDLNIQQIAVYVGNFTLETSQQDWRKPWSTSGDVRPVINTTMGSVVASQTAAALASSGLAYQMNNYTDLSNNLITRAKAFYDFAQRSVDLYVSQTNWTGDKVYIYGQGLVNGNYTYTSQSAYDDMFWASVWLYAATKDPDYLVQAETAQVQHLQKEVADEPTNASTVDFDWDDLYWGANLLFNYYMQGKNQTQDMADYFRGWMCGNNVSYTEDKRAYSQSKPSLQTLANAIYLGLVFSSDAYQANLVVPNPPSFTSTIFCWSLQQTNYILGHNSQSLSYLLGLDHQPSPLFIQDQNTACPDSNCTLKDSLYSIAPNPSVLYGGLTNGPIGNRTYVDDRLDVDSIVRLEYGAAMPGIFAAIMERREEANQCSIQEPFQLGSSSICGYK